MAVKPSIAIVLASYNGERWLADQVASFQAQSHKEWHLLISDDGSNDSTLAVAQRLATADSRISILPRRTGAAGHVGNFAYLLEVAHAQGYSQIFLSDQDDLWDEQKLSLLSGSLNSAAKGSAAFSDLELVDEGNQPLGGYLDSLGLRDAYSSSALLQQNCVPGCAMAVDAALLQLALPFPPGLQNHDWWLALCASASAELCFVEQRLVRYRQHSGNAIGRKSPLQALLSCKDILRRQRRVFDAKLRSTAMLIERLRVANKPVPAALESFNSSFNGCSGWRRVWRFASSSFRPRATALFLAQLLCLTPFFDE